MGRIPHFYSTLQRIGSVSYLTGRRILVTGGAGFLGREVCQALEAYRPSLLFVPRSRDYDLRRPEAIRGMLRLRGPK